MQASECATQKVDIFAVWNKQHSSCISVWRFSERLVLPMYCHKIGYLACSNLCTLFERNAQLEKWQICKIFYVEFELNAKILDLKDRYTILIAIPSSDLGSPHIIISKTEANEFIMCTLLNDPSIGHDKNYITVLNG